MFQQVLNLKTESFEIVNALATLSAFYGENSPAERRTLRTKVEKRNTTLNQDYLAAADPVIQVSWCKSSLNLRPVLRAHFEVSRFRVIRNLS